MIEIIYDSNY